MPELLKLVDTLEREHALSTEDYARLIRERTPELAELLRARAVSACRRVYGNKVFIRGLIEFSNYCKNNCLYCGIRNGNRLAERFRLSPEEILDCCRDGYGLGFRTFVLQSGEDPWFSDERLVPLVASIKAQFPDCAVTLSVGERSFESYRRLKEAGADRYLLRHETANEAHYQSLHPASMSFRNRMDCLCALKELGYQVGCGFMVGSPGQTAAHLAEDLKFIERFRPQMCGIGPFIPHQDTPFRDKAAGSVELTCYLLSILRLMQPNLLLPATTALGTLDPMGREKGILSGANVVMPNLSPVSVRKKYALYDHKICTGEESAQCIVCLRTRIEAVGCEIVTDRGDPKPL